MGTVRGNLGTALEHAALVSSVQWALENSTPRTGPLLYVDTHAMAPLSEDASAAFPDNGRRYRLKTLRDRPNPLLGAVL